MTIHDETDALTVRAGRWVTPDSAQPTALDVRERGLRLAGMAALVGAGAELAHGIQDVHRGLLRSNALTGYVAVAVLVVAGIGLGGAAVRGHRRAAVPLVVVGLLWTVGAVADHPGAFTNPGQFRTGWPSAVAVWLLVATNLAVMAWAAAPALPTRFDRLKAEPGEGQAATARGELVLDVRSSWERIRHPVPGTVAARVTRPEDALGPGRAGPVLVICSHGARSLVATTRLRRMGVAARSLTGGETALRR